ncbi:MAG: TusE/DsrC/DsvC family sulfur relay protein [Deltaproteobacteria bacterium]|nr:TusE/DsrC/DsvC family sulfur relay protein [Deltaproteobacteria bacterium]
MNDSAIHNLEAGDVHQKFRLIAGKEVLIDKEGFLWHVEDWTEEVAVALASECGIETLSNDQWRVIRFLRDYFSYHGRAPLNRDLRAGLGISLMELECLFPGGIRHGARRVAGLPNPRACTG